MKKNGVQPVQIPNQGLSPRIGLKTVALPPAVTLTELRSGELRAALGGATEQFLRDWQHSEASLRSRLRTLPAQSKGLIEMQLAASSLHRKAELIGRAAETVHETIRKVQQAAGQ